MAPNHQKINDLNELNDEKIFSFFYQRACEIGEILRTVNQFRDFLYGELESYEEKPKEATTYKLENYGICHQKLIQCCTISSFVYYRSMFQTFKVSEKKSISILPEAYGFGEKEKSSHNLVVQYVNANIAHQDSTYFSQESKQIDHNEEKKNSYGRHQYKNLKIQGNNYLLFCDSMPNISELEPLMPKIIAQIRDVYKSKFKKEDMPELFSRKILQRGRY